IHAGHGLGGGGRGRHAGGRGGADGFRIEIVRGDGKALLDEILGHGQAHGPHADEANARHLDSPTLTVISIRLWGERAPLLPQPPAAPLNPLVAVRGPPPILPARCCWDSSSSLWPRVRGARPARR